MEPDVRRDATAFMDAERMRVDGLPVLEHQRLALERAGRAVEAHRPGLREQLERAMRRDPEVGASAREGRARGLLQAAEQSPPPKRDGLERERTRGRGEGQSGSQRSHRDRGT